MKPYTHIFWDFNGTLLDDVDACIQSANRLLSAHTLPTLPDKRRYRELFGFPIVDYYKRLGFDFDKTPYADLAVEWVAYYLENSAACALYPDVIDALRQARACGARQMILSATERTMLQGQVEKLGITEYFDGLLGLDNIRAYSKEEIACRWKAAHPDSRVLLIGDTDHDAAVAEVIGADCALIARGHQTRAHLERCRSIGVFDSLEAFFNGE